MRRTPGDLLLHPAGLLALAVVIVNDGWVKHRFPGIVSGKLSDFAGLVYFPLFVVACLEGLRWSFRRRTWEMTPRSVVTVAVVVGAAFLFIKTWYPAAEFYRSALGVALWPVSAAGNILRGQGLPRAHRVSLVQDRTDLVALVALCLPVWISSRVMGTHRTDDASAPPPSGRWGR